MGLRHLVAKHGCKFKEEDTPSSTSELEMVHSQDTHPTPLEISSCPTLELTELRLFCVGGLMDLPTGSLPALHIVHLDQGRATGLN